VLYLASKLELILSRKISSTDRPNLQLNGEGETIRSNPKIPDNLIDCES